MNSPTLHPRTARTTGLLYLALAVVAIPGFLIIRPMLFDPDSAASTLANLVEDESLARLGIGLELALVAAQALVALWFYRLFRRVDSFAAVSLTAFGLINAVAILASAACLGGALDVALAPSSVDAAGGAQLLYVLGGSFWEVGALFFGLWLIPMGVLALRSGMPRPLGWILVAGGIGYIVSGFLAYLVPAAAPASELLVIPATIGEFWMIGWLLWYSVRARAVADETSERHSEPVIGTSATR
ncbi:DUF4386 domain-containing protein [Promicromonospora soli]|uniref:DUF4386 domain-containing protein n=1 Tax=Promicromonospora soli TaxID=2035533 RepID=A0A919KZH2_9MICO|nr:DUF4386 domain-containing protein [Promicromonospora soli]GHH78342.1 hypothetical protein GCM10017772_41460 [Promicromonospora soli]